MSIRDVLDDALWCSLKVKIANVLTDHDEYCK